MKKSWILILIGIIAFIAALAMQGQADYARCKLSHSESYCFAQIQ